ncbi:MAG: ABC transporter permease [Nocardiopsaceae bacterium]|jgi:peptide/nickel transport system permease protein|nr:ABC transporter permease [Nocardiopsaceae bacterium]
MATLRTPPEPGGPLEPGATEEAQAPTLLTTEATGGLPTFGGGITGARSVRRMARAITANRKATAGALILLFFIVVAAIPGQIAPYDPNAEAYPKLLHPSAQHWLGTTALGQDIFSQVVWGTRPVLLIAFGVGLGATVIAMLVGVAAAYLGGWSDGVLSLITDVLLVIPLFPLLIVISSYLHGAGTGVMILVITLTGWSYTARQLRSQALSLRHRDFLEAARVRGERARYVIAVEIIPTMTSLLVAAFLTNALYAVLFSSGLQFIGLGNPNVTSWGTMLYWAENNEAFQVAPLWIIVPGLCIVALGAAFALLNYAFDEIGNPALRPVRSMRRKRVKRSG